MLLSDIYRMNNDDTMSPMALDGKNDKISAMETAGPEVDPGTNQFNECGDTVHKAFYGFMEDGIKFGDPPVQSFYDEPMKKVLTYRPEGIRSFLLPFFQHDLSACYNFWVWIKHLAIVAYAVILSLILAYEYYPDGEMGELACSDLKNRNMCTLEVTLGDAKLEFRFLIAFILAGYVGNSINNWNKRRSTYASLCGNVKNCLCTINSIVSKKNDPRNARSHISRWALLVYELSVLKARGHMDSAPGKEYLEALSLLQPGEWDCMCPRDRHTTVIYWISTMIVGYQREGIISPDHSQTALDAVSNLRSYANDLMSSIHVDEPISYCALTGLLVKTNVFIFSTWKAVEWSVWIRSFGPDVLFNEQSRMVVDIFVLLAWNISYTALYDLSYMLNNPFGNRRIDLPHETIGAGLRNFANALTKEGHKLPPAFKDT